MQQKLKSMHRDACFNSHGSRDHRVYIVIIQAVCILPASRGAGSGRQRGLFFLFLHSQSCIALKHPKRCSAATEPSRRLLVKMRRSNPSRRAQNGHGIDNSSPRADADCEADYERCVYPTYPSTTQEKMTTVTIRQSANIRKDLQGPSCQQQPPLLYPRAHAPSSVRFCGATVSVSLELCSSSDRHPTCPSAIHRRQGTRRRVFGRVRGQETSDAQRKVYFLWCSTWKHLSSEPLSLQLSYHLILAF